MFRRQWPASPPELPSLPLTSPVILPFFSSFLPLSFSFLLPFIPSFLASTMKAQQWSGNLYPSLIILLSPWKQFCSFSEPLSQVFLKLCFLSTVRLGNAEDIDVHACACSLSHVLLSVTPWTVPTRLLCPWDSPGKNNGVDSHSLLQGILLTQGSNSCFLNWQVDSLPLNHLGSPKRNRTCSQRPPSFPEARAMLKTAATSVRFSTLLGVAQSVLTTPLH